MIPQLKCFDHDQDIILLSLEKDVNKQHRTLCPLCMEKMQLGQLCTIQNISLKTQQFAKVELDKLSQQYNPQMQRFSKIKKSIATLRDKSNKMFDDIIQSIDDLNLSFKKVLDDELIFFKDSLKDITRSKLEDLGDLLSGHIIRDCRKKQPGLKLIEFGNEFAIQVRSYINEFKLTVQEIKSILNNEMVLKGSIQLQDICRSLISNQKESLLACGVSNQIIVFEKRKKQLVQSAVLTLHRDLVTAIVVYESGEMILSGSAQNDNSLKLWKKTTIDGKWNCIQSLQEHTHGITDLKLTGKEDQVISASRDKSIKVWIMNQEQNQLKCIQTLQEHTWQVGYLSICPSQLLMATVSWENYIIIFKSQAQEQQPWKKWTKLETEGKIHRIHFVDDSTLICQQQIPPKLIIYECNEQNEFTIKQSIVLNEPHNEDILFPIFECRGSIYCKNERRVYEIRKSTLDQYYIRSIINGEYSSGCVSFGNKGIIMSNWDNNKIEFYSIV